MNSKEKMALLIKERVLRGDQGAKRSDPKGVCIRVTNIPKKRKIGTEDVHQQTLVSPSVMIVMIL